VPKLHKLRIDRRSAISGVVNTSVVADVIHESGSSAFSRVLASSWRSVA
jgi:hypothetical protein